MNTHIFILYDGIQNSVFESQVLQPLLQQKNEYDKTILISFESHPNALKKYVPKDPGIEIILLKKIPFLGSISLYYAAKQLKKILSAYHDYHITARGPLAGFICLHTTKIFLTCTIQIRGLLAQEYLYAKKDDNNPLKKIIYQFRVNQMHTVEKKVLNTNKPNVFFESVSSALKEYLINTFGAQPNKITIAKKDIPQTICIEQKNKWRTAIRAELTIKKEAQVFCYNGSAKPWQCPQKVVSFFKQEYEKNNNSFLLLLTQDKKIFAQLLQEKNMPKDAYTIKTVPHTDIYIYLSACDTGLLFRDQHIINWVSRPTKILEYRAVGLKIIHNNTVGMLSPFDTFCS